MVLLKGFAKIVSGVLSPLLMPLYIYLTIIVSTYLALLPLNSLLLVISIVTIFTVIIPFITLAWKVANEEDKIELSKKTYPYYISATAYLFTAYMLYKIGLPLWMASFLVGGAITAIILALLRKSYNISAHMAGIGSYIGVLYTLTGLKYVIPIELLTFIIICTGILGSCRTYLKDQTPGELITGLILGFIWSCSAFYIGILI